VGGWLCAATVVAWFPAATDGRSNVVPTRRFLKLETFGEH
jgi:hypothetical protein